MAEKKVDLKVKEYQYNNLLDSENHLLVAKSQLVVNAYDLWTKDEITFEYFKKILNDK